MVRGLGLASWILVLLLVEGLAFQGLGFGGLRSQGADGVGAKGLKAKGFRLSGMGIEMSSQAQGGGKPLDNIIDGKAIAQSVRDEVRAEAIALKEKYSEAPGLAVVIVGDRKDSQTYVRNKVKACDECHIRSVKKELPENISQELAIKTVRELNADPQIHAILVQLPLPAHLNEAEILEEISLEKDVDGFHPTNIGLLAMRDRHPSALPCTPAGIMEILKRKEVTIRGSNAVIMGRSNIVGMPVALLLLQADAHVQILHSRTPQQEVERSLGAADIVIGAVGKPNLIKGDWLKPGCVVIDVGINAVEDSSKKNGYRLVGDVDFQQAKEKASLITPVPGGVGPMTIAMLLRNTVNLASKHLKNKDANN